MKEILTKNIRYNEEDTIQLEASYIEIIQIPLPQRKMIWEELHY